MSALHWRLADYLAERKLTAYALGKAMGISYMNTVYKMAKPGYTPSRLDMAILLKTLDGLRTLTGEEVKLTDILVYQVTEETD